MNELDLHKDWLKHAKNAFDLANSPEDPYKRGVAASNYLRSEQDGVKPEDMQIDYVRGYLEIRKLKGTCEYVKAVIASLEKRPEDGKKHLKKLEEIMAGCDKLEQIIKQRESVDST